MAENKFTEKMLDDMAWARRVNSFGDDFKNYITNYLIQIKNYEHPTASLHAEEMARAYFNSDRNLICLWQDYINDKDTRDAIISLINNEFHFDMIYFEKGIYVRK